MHAFNILTLVLVFLAILAYLNAKLTKLPPTIAYMLGSLILAGALLILRSLNIPFVPRLITTLADIDFSATVLYGILSFLLFAGALQLDVRDLATEKWTILTLATFSVVISAFLVGSLMYYVYQALSVPLPYLYCLLFGALISPTDPVIVINMLKGTATPNRLKVKVMGESLFNDGIAIVLFVVILTLAQFRTEIDAADITVLLIQQIAGSAILGLGLGWLTGKLITTVGADSVRILITMGIVAGGYDLAISLNISGPITIVIMGLVVRNFPGQHNFNALYGFWGLLDEFLNAGLFVLMGLELLTIPLAGPFLAAAIIGILVVLLSRYISVYIPIRIFRFFRPFPRFTVALLTWMGLRGGVSLALGLSLPPSRTSHAIWTATYTVVIFSTIVQGLTFRHYIRRKHAI